MDKQEPSNYKDEFGHINTGTLKILLESKTPVVLLDARAPKGDESGKIPGAISLTSEASNEEIASSIPHIESLIIVYCSHTQCGASGRLANRLKELGYPFIIKYPGGIDEWANQGHPVEQDGTT